VSAYPGEILSVSLDVAGGMLWGTSREYVLTNAYALPRVDSMLSRLDWQEKTVPYVDMTVRFEAFNVFIAGSFLTALPQVDGTESIMEDRDWDNPDGTLLSQYSRHDISIDKHYDLSAELGYSFKVRDFRITPSAGFSYRARKWTGTDGYGQYASIWTEDTEKQAFTGPVITYEQAVWFPSITLEAAYNLNSLFEFSAAYRFFPYIDTETLDTHITTKTQYRDMMAGGWGNKIMLNIRWFFLKDRLTLNLGGAYEWWEMWPGETYSRKTGGPGSANQFTPDVGQSKADSSQWSLSLGLRVSIF
jgi:outer membrane protease